jgi:hypothetical protein
LNVSIVYSPKPTIIADGQHQTGDSFTLGETIHFGNLEFIVKRFGSLSLSDEGNTSSSGAAAQAARDGGWTMASSPTKWHEDAAAMVVQEGVVARASGRRPDQGNKATA